MSREATIAELMKRLDMNLDDFTSWCEDNAIEIFDDNGDVDAWKLDDQLLELFQGLNVRLHHMTSSWLKEDIQAQGLIVGEPTNHGTSGAGVYLTTDPCCNASDLYVRAAQAKHGGHYLQVMVSVPVDSLRPDPDDSGLRALVGKQFIVDHVPPSQIRGFIT